MQFLKKKDILFSSTSQRLGYEFQRHEKFPNHDCLMSHNLDLLDIVVCLIRMVEFKPCNFFYVGKSF